MSNFDPSKIFNQVSSKLTIEKEKLIEELNTRKMAYKTTSQSLRDLQIKRIDGLKELSENKLTNSKIKREIEIKRKFLEGVYRIQIPLLNEEIEIEFNQISDKVTEINDLTFKLNKSVQYFEKYSCRIEIDQLFQ